MATAKGATFQVSGLGCEESRWGTAFVGGKGKLVTSAHVVTGVPFPKVVLGEDVLAARVMAIDRASDLAVLTIDKELPKPLPLANAKSGSVGVVLGYDVSGNLVVRPDPSTSLWNRDADADVPPLTLDKWQQVAIVRTSLGGDDYRWEWYYDGALASAHALYPLSGGGDARGGCHGGQACAKRSRSTSTLPLVAHRVRSAQKKNTTVTVKTL